MSSGFIATAERPPRRGPRQPLTAGMHPAQVVVAGFALAVLVGTGLLLLPQARSAPGATTLVDALFTATSAVCVTGLIVTDTPTYWSTFGHVVILALIQVGGFGIMTMASLLGLLISRRLGLRTQLTAATETKSISLGDVRAVLRGVAVITVIVETTATLILAVRLILGYGEAPGRALWLALFHSISAFNNAGFALYSDSLMRFVTDPWVSLPVAVAVVLGGLGFPVLIEIGRQRRDVARWSAHTKITVLGTGGLLVLGTAFILVAEWSNPGTLGPLNVPGKLLAGFFQGVMPRTAGFNSVDTSQMNTGTWLGTSVLMFIGGGSAGTAGGIKVTTFLVLLFVIISEVRGDDDVVVFNRRISRSAQRQALTVALLGVAAVVGPSILFVMTTPFSLDQVLFEVVSAFATVGLSTGITPELSSAHQLVLVILMFIGRIGPITLATALALRTRTRLYRLPEERPIIG